MRIATCVGAVTVAVMRARATPFSSVLSTIEVTSTLVPGVTKRKSPWNTSKRMARFVNLMPFWMAVTATSASPPLHNPAQPVPVGAIGVMVTVLLSVVALTFNVMGTVTPRLSRIVMTTGVSTLTFFAMTVILNPVVADPTTVGVGTTTVLLLPAVYGGVPPLMAISVGKSANTSAVPGSTPSAITGGGVGATVVVLAAPPPPHEPSNALIAPRAAMTTACFAQLPVLLK